MKFNEKKEVKRMKKNPSTFLKLFFLVLFCTLTVVNLISSDHYCDYATEGSWRCDYQAARECRNECGQGNCEDYYWYLNYCYVGLCFEYWEWFCTDQSHGVYECLNSAFWCPI